MNISKSEYFKRQTTLSEIGEEGQQLLQKANILVIGCGGLGSPVAIYLAASGVGNIHLVDFDTISISNLHRQVFYNTATVEKSKAAVLASEIAKKTPFTNVTFSEEAVSKTNILELVSKFDVVVDGTDNLQIKYLINDACVLTKKPLVYGSLYKFDGYVATFNVFESKAYSCNLRDAFPKIATDIPNCGEAGTMNPIVGLIALLQVNEVIKLITKTGKLLTNQLLIYNALENSQFKMKLKKNESIAIEEIFKNSTYGALNCATQKPILLISKGDFKLKLNDTATEIISVINNINTPIPFEVHQKKPFHSFDIENFNPDFTKNYVIVCNKGITSYNITQQLKDKFPALNVLSLAEGIENY
ncbi:adenylyltransferase and sulfurtransferase [Lutibacter agarilyticus]|uniref:Adenylyltransferase and sulfurtransferase n=1 Tax=Lutibacter agarilyticus TaxID=1109740 RepID=A0A238VSI8_9FLAO|nr:HesA/MoeB/ThiF family protein [Lutibacter agarilyticus]SNR37208.1 adenylyltransferase and sulfurtransferase [Lutibacter agarilyticus]